MEGRPIAQRATFKGYGPEQGYAFLREAIATHDYAARNPQQPYVRAVAAPKVEKLRKVHADMLKETR
jgi:hypothetical protein